MNEDQNCIMLYSLKYLGGVSIIKLTLNYPYLYPLGQKNQINSPP